MTPYYADESVTVYAGECLDMLCALPECSVDAVVTDPPYGISFMGKEWDQPGKHGSTKRNGTPSVDRRGADGVLRPISNGAMAAGRYDLSANARFGAWCLEWVTECLRILKPGGHLVAFGGSRTWHRLAAAVEDAGFEIRDSIAWLYGSGFPKSLDVSKAIDKRRDWAALPLLQAKVREARTVLGISQSEAARRCGLIAVDEKLGGGGFMWFETGMRVPTKAQYSELKAALGLDDECDKAFEDAEREVTGEHTGQMPGFDGHRFTSNDTLRRDKPATDAAEKWRGWGTALKPAFEPIVVGRKPLVGTVAANVQTHGTGALNIDGCRIASEPISTTRTTALGVMNDDGWQPKAQVFESHAAGRWPTNVVLDGSQADALDAQTGVLTSGLMRAGITPKGERNTYGRDAANGYTRDADTYGDSGGASRFFPTFHYEAKAPTSERPRNDDGTAHPTVKPLDLMRWLVQLVTPPGGLVCDPFLGSGTTAEACVIEGFRCIGAERDPDYLPLITARLTKPIQVGLDFTGGAA